MTGPNLPPKFACGTMSPDIAERVARSFSECEELTERTVKCPHCGSILAVVFSDASGHQRYKCRKCKAVTVMNLAYFRRFLRRAGPRRSYFGRLKSLDDGPIGGSDAGTTE